MVLGRSAAPLESYLERLEGKNRVRVICMDLASAYRVLARKHFPNARIVADRFHVIRLINRHFLACWREIDATGAKHRGLLLLMRRHRHHLSSDQQVRLAAYLAAHPVLEVIYRFKQRLCYLLLKKHKTRKQCEHLAPRFFACSSAKLCTLGRQRSPPCGASLATMPSPKDSIQNGGSAAPGIRILQLSKLSVES